MYALRPLSLSVRPGEMVGVVGESGAGKSTIVKVLTGIYQPDTGVIEIDLETHVVIPRAPMRRASSSDPSRASIEMAIEIRVRRSAPASPPGICVSV